MGMLGSDDWTEEYHALIDGKAQVDVYVTWRKDIFFQYPGQEPQPAITKRYRVADSHVFLNALEKRTAGDFGLSPGELLDESGKRFTVMQPGLDLFDPDPTPVAAIFDLEEFFVELKGSPPVQSRIGATAHLVGLFLDEYPDKGGSIEFIGWAKTHPAVKSVEHGGNITWTDPAGRQQVKETKTVTNCIGRLRKKRQQQ